MLVLSRKRDESIVIGENIVVTVVDVRSDKVRLGISAPDSIPIYRSEVHEALQREKQRELEKKLAALAHPKIVSGEILKG